MYQHIFVHFGLIEGIGPSTVQKIIDLVGVDNIQDVYRYSVADFVAIGFVEPKAQLLVDGLANTKMLDRELELIAKHSVTIVTRHCPEYSSLLAQIHVPPVVLYCQGNVDLLSAPKTIACVGARKAHRYALEAFGHMITPLIQDGWVVVSGGAAGADTYAHQATLEQGGKTIVVVGTGLCHVYPLQNRKLFESVALQGGLIVSIFPMDTHQNPGCFPARNRIISGLSMGCVVFQAAAKSGALITATQALDQGREVFAVPGSIFDPLSAGCHDLIQQGAKLVTSTHDILVEFDSARLLDGQRGIKSVDQQVEIFSATKSSSLEQGSKKDRVTYRQVVTTAYKPGSVEQQIVDSVVVPMTADALMQKTQIDLVTLQSILFALSLDGLVRQDGMGFWTRV